MTVTATWQPPVRELPPTTTNADRWDRRWFQEAHDTVDRLREVTEELGDVHEAGPDALRDMWAILSKADPKVLDTVRPDRAINRMIAEQLLDSEGVQDLRHFTEGSQAKTTLGCLAMAQRIRELYEDPDVQDAQDKAEAAQEAQEQLDDLEAEAEGGEGDDDDEQDGDGDGDGQGEDGEGGSPGPTQADIDAAREAAQAAQQAAQEALDRIGPKIGRACREAAADAAEEAEEREQMMSAWGSGDGEWDRMNPAEFIEKVDELDDPTLRHIARILGAMENVRIGSRKEKIDAVPTEVYDVELGNDIGRLLPTEMIGLVVPELEDDFYRRYAGRQLMQYRLRSTEYVAKGSIVVLEDGSGSMSGTKFAWAKAFGLALGSIAREENRAFHVIEFGDVDCHEHHDFPDRAAWTAEARLAYAESFLHDGGTDFMSVLTAGVKVLAAEHETTGKVQGDLVMTTDGIADVDPAWLARFHEVKEQLGFRVYALLIGHDARVDTLAKFADYVGTIEDLTGGNDVRDVFRKLA